mgnify:CR=1 FL=1
MRNKRPSLAGPAGRTADAGPADGIGGRSGSPARPSETPVPISHRTARHRPAMRVPGRPAHAMQRRWQSRTGYAYDREPPCLARGRQLRAKGSLAVSQARPRQPCRPCARTRSPLQVAVSGEVGQSMFRAELHRACPATRRFSLSAAASIAAHPFQGKVHTRAITVREEGAWTSPSSSKGVTE